MKWFREYFQTEIANYNNLFKHKHNDDSIAVSYKPTAAYLTAFVYSKAIELDKYLIGCLKEIEARVYYTYQLDWENRLMVENLKAEVAKDDYFRQ